MSDGIILIYPGPTYVAQLFTWLILLGAGPTIIRAIFLLPHKKGLPMRYRRLDMIDRCTIQTMLGEGRKRNEIARALGVHPSTITREINKRPRASDGSYYYGLAQENFEERLTWRKKRRKLKGDVLSEVLESLSKYHSPEQISKRLSTSVHPETIYRYLKQNEEEGGQLYKFLRRSGRKRRSRYPKIARRKFQESLPSIELRSSQANERAEIGHWERDTFYGRQRSATILILVDRKSRLTRLKLLRNLKKHQMTTATCNALKDLPVKSITNDRGLEFQSYEKLQAALQKPIYFCHPYTSQERGTVENTIGLIRQFLPKKTDLSKVTQADLNTIENLLNHRPRKVLGFLTPWEVLNKNNCTA